MPVATPNKLPPPPGDAEYRKARAIPEADAGYKIDLGEK